MRLRNIYQKLNREQKKAFSSFFNSIAVGWFIAVFATQHFEANFNPLTLMIYIANMILALGLSLFFLREE